MSNTPSATSPGAIGVAILDDSSTAPGSWSVAVAFGRNDAAPSVFEIVVSNLDVSDLESDTPPRVVVYFCGAIRDSLAVTELNSGPLQVERLPATAVEFDSGLGYRSECDYTISAFSNGWQTLMSGTSAFQYENVDGSNVSYTAPRLTTLLAPEELLDETVMPLPRDSTVDVTLRDLPADLEIRSSTPQIPATGQTHWSFAAVPVTQPDVFRINGEVGHLINQSQVYLFAAGALSGVAGAALLWCLELALSEGGRGRSRSSRTTVPHRVPASRG